LRYKNIRECCKKNGKNSHVKIASKTSILASLPLVTC